MMNISLMDWLSAKLNGLAMKKILYEVENHFARCVHGVVIQYFDIWKR